MLVAILEVSSNSMNIEGNSFKKTALTGYLKAHFILNLIWIMNRNKTTPSFET